MSNDNAILNFKYAFIPDPLPIRASQSGTEPNHTDLFVMVSNPKLYSIDMSKITIKIPVGEQTARSLSADPNLPAPVYDQSGQWKITDSGSTITIEPKTGEKAVVTDTISFKLPQITVNSTEGIVPIMVVEYPPDEPKRVDGDSYELAKQPSDFPVTAFYAEPAVITKPEEGTTLFWKCSDQGKKYSFQLHSDSWRPKDVYSWEDGEKGVATPVLMQSTVFALVIMEADPQGHLKIRDTLYTTVEQVVPHISSQSYQSTTLSGRIVDLHWIAFNASKCRVERDARVIDKDASTNTYDKGYLASPTGEGSYEFTVRAFDKTGMVQTAHSFPDVRLETKSLPVCESAFSGAVTPDNKLVLISAGRSPNGAVTVIDLEEERVTQNLTIAKGSGSVSITPDGNSALVLGGSGYGYVTFINLRTLTVEANEINTGLESNYLKITPDGKYALVTNGNYPDNQVVCVDLSSREVKYKVTVGKSPGVIAVTPDSATALISNWKGNTVSVLDVENGAINKTISVGKSPMGMAITPDGKKGFVSNMDDSSISVIDIAKGEVIDTVAVGQSPNFCAVTSDGTNLLVSNDADCSVSIVDIATIKVAATLPVGKGRNHFLTITPNAVAGLVSNPDDSTVSLINISRREVADTITVDKYPCYIAVTSDNNHAVVVNNGSKTATII